jgi:hypothetical protein
MAIRKTNVRGFVKNTTTGVILNNDNNEFIKHKQEREKIEQFNSMKDELAALRKDFEELKKKVLND